MQIHITIDEHTDDVMLLKIAAMVESMASVSSGARPLSTVDSVVHIEQPVGPSIRELIDTGHLSKPPAGFGNDPLPPAAAGGAADAKTSDNAQGDLPGTSVSSGDHVAPTGTRAGATPTPAERDSTGLVWDERIHSGSKSVNKDGSWRNRKNLDPLFITQTEQQLRAMDQGQVVEKPSIVPKPPTPQGNQLTFGAIVKQWQTLISEGVMTQDDGNALLQLQGVNLLPELMKRPDLWAGFVASLPKLPE